MSRTKEQKAICGCIKMSITKKSASNVWWINGELALLTTDIGFSWGVCHLRMISFRMRISLSQWFSIGSLADVDLRYIRKSSICPDLTCWKAMQRNRPSECLARYVRKDDCAAHSARAERAAQSISSATSQVVS